MNVTGPAPISIVQRYDNSDLVLRMNQRIAAEVMQVTGDRVVLSVNGVPIVARLTSSEQAAQLIERRIAQFIVRDTSSNMVMLQLLPPTSNTENLTSQQLFNLVKALLQQADLAFTETNFLLARSLLEHGLPVEASLINQLNHTLEQIEGWGEPEAQIAAAFIAGGFVLSPQIIQAFVKKFPDLGEVILQLINGLRRYIAANQNEQKGALAQEPMEFLQSFILDLSHPQQEIAQQLQWLVKIFNRPIENVLAELAKNPQMRLSDRLDTGLLSLLTFYWRLQSEANLPKITQDIERFFDTIRREQFFNLQSDPNNPKSQWYRILIPLNFELHNSGLFHENRLQTVNIRIAYLPEQVPLRIDANHTRFIVQVELNKGLIEVDVSLAQQKVGVHVRTNDLLLLEKAQEEIQTLQEGISLLGYQIQNTQCELCELEPISEMGGAAPKNWGEVSLEI